MVQSIDFSGPLLYPLTEQPYFNYTLMTIVLTVPAYVKHLPRVCSYPAPCNKAALLQFTPLGNFIFQQFALSAVFSDGAIPCRLFISAAVKAFLETAFISIFLFLSLYRRLSHWLFIIVCRIFKRARAAPPAGSHP